MSKIIFRSFYLYIAKIY